MTELQAVANTQGTFVLPENTRRLTPGWLMDNRYDAYNPETDEVFILDLSFDEVLGEDRVHGVMYAKLPGGTIDGLTLFGEDVIEYALGTVSAPGALSANRFVYVRDTEVELDSDWVLSPLPYRCC